MIKQKHRINPSMPKFLFSVYARDIKLRISTGREGYQDYCYEYDKIMITNLEAKKYIQGILPYDNGDFLLETIGGSSRRGSKFDFDIIDMNFDGYDDIIILKYTLGNKANSYYYCYLWDNKSRSYVEDKKLEELPDIYFDEDTKTIGSQETATGYHSTKEYQYIDGILTLVHEITTDTIPHDNDGNDGVTYEKKLINGKMKTIYEEYFQWKG